MIEWRLKRTENLQRGPLFFDVEVREIERVRRALEDVNAPPCLQLCITYIFSGLLLSSNIGLNSSLQCLDGICRFGGSIELGNRRSH